MLMIVANRFKRQMPSPWFPNPQAPQIPDVQPLWNVVRRREEEEKPPRTVLAVHSPSVRLASDFLGCLFARVMFRVTLIRRLLS